MDAELTRIAEACDIVAGLADDNMLSEGGCKCRTCQWYEGHIALLRSHARAIRAGRVTVNEGGNDGTV